jgi:diguanylate cyclase (GGDEF)-like protein
MRHFLSLLLSLNLYATTLCPINNGNFTISDEGETLEENVSRVLNSNSSLEVKWLTLLRNIVLLDLCSGLGVDLENRGLNDQHKDALNDDVMKNVIKDLYSRPTPFINSMPSIVHLEIPVGETTSPTQYARSCVQTQLIFIRNYLLKNPEMLSNIPPENIFNWEKVLEIRQEQISKVISPKLNQDFIKDEALLKLFWNELNRDWIGNAGLARDGITGLPRALWENVVALKDLIVLTVREPAKVRDGFVELYHEFSENPSDTFLNMMLTDDPAQAAAAVVEMFFGAKGSKLVSNKIVKLISKGLSNTQLDNLLSGITNQKVVAELKALAKSNPEEFAQKYSEQVIKEKLEKMVVDQVTDPEVKKSLLEGIETNPAGVVEKLVKDSMGSWYDPKFSGAFNAHGLKEVAPLLAREAIRRGENLYVAQIDLGNFKIINDVLGHGVGDDVLGGFIESIKDSTRGMDIVTKTAREGGDEFAITISAKNATDADMVMKRIIEKYNGSELLAKVKADMIEKGIAPKQADYLTKALGPDWENKLKTMVTPGEADFSLAEISAENLSKLAQNSDRSVLKNALDEADASLTTKKLDKRNKQGTQRVRE